MKINQFIESLNRLPEDLYVLIETQDGKILPAGITTAQVSNKGLNSAYLNFDEFGVIFIQTIRKSIHLRTTLTNDLRIDCIKIAAFLNAPQSIIKLIHTYSPVQLFYGEENYSCIIKQIDRCCTIKEVKQKAIRLMKKFDSIKKFKAIIFRYRLNGLDILKDSILTTVFSGIGLNKETIELNNLKIDPGKAVVISTILNKRNSKCDFSIRQKDGIKTPKKYTKLLMKLQLK